MTANTFDTQTVGSECSPRSIDLELSPLPVMLDGLTVVADRLKLMETRLRFRRRAVAVSSRAFEQERLLRSPATNMVHFLSLEASVSSVRCARTGTLCVVRRGQTVEPTVYIDEALLIGGLDFLTTYMPHELHLVEVYSQGLVIRAYTHQFMERMARHPIVLTPLGVGR